MPLTAALLLASAAVFSPYAEECAEIARLDAAANARPLDRAALRARAAEAMGGFPERTPLNARTVGVIERDGYTIEKVVFESRPRHHVTAHLFLPDPAKFPAPHPAVLMPCGHADEGKLFPMHHRAGVIAARGGFAALMCDPVDQGERRQRADRPLDGVIGHTDAGLRAHLLGWNIAQFRVWDGIRAVDYLCSRKDIDAKRLGVSGFSGGGTLTSYLNLMDDRFATACPMAFITDFPSLAKGPGPQDSEQVIHGQLAFGLNHLALLTSAFPKPVCPGFSFDDFFPYDGSRATFALARERYAAAGLADRLDRLECPGRHGWYASEQHGLVLWMRRWLNGDASALPFDRDALRALDAADGFEVCPDGEVLPGGVLSLQGERSVFDILRDEFVRLAAVRGPISPAMVRRIAGIWENIPGAPRASTVAVRIEDGCLSVSDGVAYDRGVKDYWYTRGGPREELAAMMSWRGANLVARQAEEIIRHAERSERRKPFVLRSARETAVAAAHAFYLRRDLFASIALDNPPPSWRSALEDPSVELRFADLVYGALKAYDWTDLIDGARTIAPSVRATPDADTAVFRGVFAAPGEIRRAELSYTAFGVARVFVNGHEAEPDHPLKPGLTHVDKRRAVLSADVGGFLDRRPVATNVVEAVVAASWWRDQVVNAPAYSSVRDTSAFRANLLYETGDGVLSAFPTDGSWTADYCGKVVSATIFGGERYDAARDAVPTAPARVLPEYEGVLDRRPGPPVVFREDLRLSPLSAWTWKGADGADEDRYGRARVIRRWNVGETMRLSPGETLVVDFGQNCAGVPEFRFSSRRGVTLSAVPAEMLNDSEGEKSRGNDGPAGSVYRANYRASECTASYRFADEDAAAYRPSFTFFGGRYWSVTADGPVEISSFTYLPVSSVAESDETLELRTGSDAVNQLVSNCIWGMRSNYLSVPTDCPQRDERQGWTGDAQAYVGTAVWNADVRAFLGKWMTDMRDSQMTVADQYPGSFREVAPPGPAGCGGHRVGWSDAGVIVPYEVWRHYGDTGIVSANWDAMMKFVALLRRTGYRTFPNDYQSADWLSMERYEQRRWFEGRQPADETEVDKRTYWAFLGAAYRIRDLRMMSEMGRAIGKHETASVLSREAGECAAEFRRNYFTADGNLLPIFDGMQTPLLFVLALDLAPDSASSARCKARLAALVRECGCTVRTGFLGTSILLDTLSDALGDVELAYSVLLNPEFPGWLYSVSQGATTVWERWNSYTKEKGFGPVGMNSFNHYAYGSVEGWIVRTAAGIRPGPEGGFRHFVLTPHPDRRLGSCHAKYRSPQGEIVSSWRYGEDGVCRWTYTVPEGATATIRLPDGAVREAEAGTSSMALSDSCAGRTPNIR